MGTKFINRALDNLLDLGGIEDIRARAKETRERLERLAVYHPPHMEECEWLADITLLLGTVERQAAAIQELRVSGVAIKVIGGPDDDGKRWVVHPITTAHRERLRGLGAPLDPEMKLKKKGKR